MIKKIQLKKKQKQKLPARITNDTVAEHREKVLAGGRKLKYPLQYTRTKLVRNTIIISLAALLVLAALVWAQLYIWKDTSDLAYRVTRVLPLPIARIDGESVRYSDYLLYHRSTMAVLEEQKRLDGDMAADRVRFQQQQAIDKALEDAYANKIAKERNIQISDQQVDEVINRVQEESGMSKSAYEGVVKSQFNWTMDELRQTMRYTLIRRGVAFSVDDKAAKLAQTVADRLAKGEKLEAVAKRLGSEVDYNPGIEVPKGNSDGGLTQEASKLKVGTTSGAIKALMGDGYYFVHRKGGDAKNISYAYIRVPLTVFKKNFTDLKDSDKTKVYIKIN